MRNLTLAALTALWPAAALAGTTEMPVDTVVTPPAAAPATPDLIFTLRGGAKVEPEYFGSDSYVGRPDFSLKLDYLRLPGGRAIGSTDPSAVRYGLSPRGSLRFVRERSASESPELGGLNDIDLAVELGFGLGYTQRNFEAWAVTRYGVVGHEAWVGELGADVIAHPNDRWTLRAGPRLFLADDSYANTYFGVTPAESAASVSGFPAFNASGGPLSAGIEVSATYALNDRWGLTGAVRYEKLMNDAADSPITQLGSEDQMSLRIGLTRRFVLDF